MAQALSAQAQQDRRIAHAEKFIERFRYKATKARQVQSRIKTLEKLERIDVPTAAQLKARFGFPEPPRSSRVVAELDDVAVGYDDVPVLRKVDLVVERGARLGLVGPNGAGKTTLIRLVLGELAPMSGRCTVAPNVRVARFAQHQVDALNLTKSVVQELQSVAGDRPGGRPIRTIAGSFGFSGDMADRRVGELSGGERTRLALAKCMIEAVNVLVLDEPTNHLDLASCDLLEDALSAYPGTVLLVSHDRHLIRNVCTGLVAVRDGRVRQSEGVDEAVLSPVAGAVGSATPGQTTRAAAPRSGDPRAEQRRAAAGERQAKSNASRQIRQRVAKLEKELAAAEARAAKVLSELSDPDIYDDHQRVRALADEHDRAKADVARLGEEWLAASEEMERVEAEVARG
jgi:ATP-binding cassette, subfamily F, member 3